jgi:hypothetical protein
MLNIDKAPQWGQGVIIATGPGAVNGDSRFRDSVVLSPLDLGQDDGPQVVRRQPGVVVEDQHQRVIVDGE